MDDFTIYSNSYKEALINLKNEHQHYQDMNLSLIKQKRFMLMNKGIVLGYHISISGIEVDPVKIVINDLPIPQKQ
jgi:hypothetical protein